MERIKGKERNNDDILYFGLCYIVLCIDPKIRFVGIVDGNGKLRIGKYREGTEQQKVAKGQDHYNIKSSLFFSSLVLPGIKIFNKNSRKTRNATSIKVVQFNEMKLAIAPLSDKIERYLSIYLE
ncbi:MAG: hypothetical protein M3146_09060, partial [Thermoproteota archaeon]|nr:hypothetical protein [Thermoproteota archaeon]